MSRKTSPSGPTEDLPHEGARDAELCRDRAVVGTTVGKLANSAHLGAGQLGAPIALTFRWHGVTVRPVLFTAPPPLTRNMITPRLPALGNHIRRVLRTCSEPQMRRIDAVRHVAGMAHAQTFGDGAVGEYPRKPVSLPLAMGHNDSSIAVVIFGALPQPASIRRKATRRLAPKPRDLFWGKLILHDGPPFRCAMPGAATNSDPASSCPNYSMGTQKTHELTDWPDEVQTLGPLGGQFGVPHTETSAGDTRWQSCE